MLAATYVTVEDSKEIIRRRRAEVKKDELTNAMVALRLAPKQERPRFEDAKEEIKPCVISDITESGFKTIERAISLCILGDVAYIATYLDRTTEKMLFLTGANEDGMTILHLAAAEESSEMVELLVAQDTEVNAIQESERTPLMFAALRGRLKTVVVVLENCADADVKVCVGMRAVDFAKDIERNQEERCRNCLYRETTEAGNWKKRDRERFAKASCRAPQPRTEYALRQIRQDRLSKGNKSSGARCSDRYCTVHSGSKRLR
jgi:hypothetical protein